MPLIDRGRKGAREAAMMEGAGEQAGGGGKLDRAGTIVCTRSQLYSPRRAEQRKALRQTRASPAGSR